MTQRQPTRALRLPHRVQPAGLRRRLLGWFQRNRRNLPWRQDKDPYRIWVSEVMLQQTQINTVIPYYQRFIQTFPDLAQLAAAPFERVARVWSGLGYYRRARNLHAAARRVISDWGGKFPAGYELARSLPGVGDYTARAVQSIAYDQRLAVLDGNVARVVGRILAIEGHAQSGAFRSQVQSVLEQWLDPGRPGDFNQAMMELGQSVCTRRAPLCSECPLSRFCGAYALGKPESYPEPRPRRATELWHMAAAAIFVNDRVMLIKGLDDGLLGDLWNFPSAWGETPDQAGERLARRLQKLLTRSTALNGPIATVNHSITYRRIKTAIYAAELPAIRKRKDQRWVSLGNFNAVPVSQLARKIAASLMRPYGFAGDDGVPGISGGRVISPRLASASSI